MKDMAAVTADRLGLHGVGKSYGATVALTDIDLTLPSGTIHAILGENGAGKSTLVKILSGLVPPDQGEVAIDGVTVGIASAADALRLGVATVFQELSLIPDLSVAENIMMGAAPRNSFGLIDRRGEARQARAWLDRLGLRDIDPAERVLALSLAQRQLLEVAKALATRPKVLILDEATSALGSEQVATLFALLRELRAEGASILFISHRMHEIDQIADACTVLRDGRHVETFAAGSRSHHEICSLLAGRDLAQVFPPKRAGGTGEKVMSVRDLACAPRVRNVTFDLHRGEILGIGGLEGQGQHDLMLALYGVIRRAGGSIALGDGPARIQAPSDAVNAAHRVALLPEDRKVDGLLLSEPVSRNIVLSVMQKLTRFGIRQASVERDLSARMIERLRIKVVEGGEMLVGKLSGGNQQKVLLARLLALEPSILLLVDPTRGIDVGTKQEIYALIRELAEAGASIVFLSSDYEELVGLCDRVLVVYGGEVAAELEGEEITDQRIIQAAMNIGTEGARAS